MEYKNETTDACLTGGACTFKISDTIGNEFMMDDDNYSGYAGRYSVSLSGSGIIFVSFIVTNTVLVSE